MAESRLTARRASAHIGAHTATVGCGSPRGTSPRDPGALAAPAREQMVKALVEPATEPCSMPEEVRSPLLTVISS